MIVDILNRLSKRYQTRNALLGSIAALHYDITFAPVDIAFVTPLDIGEEHSIYLPPEIALKDNDRT